MRNSCVPHLNNFSLFALLNLNGWSVAATLVAQKLEAIELYPDCKLEKPVVLLVFFGDS